jgi:hypothetical protein
MSRGIQAVAEPFERVKVRMAQDLHGNARVHVKVGELRSAGAASVVTADPRYAGLGDAGDKGPEESSAAATLRMRCRMATLIKEATVPRTEVAAAAGARLRDRVEYAGTRLLAKR